MNISRKHFEAINICYVSGRRLSFGSEHVDKSARPAKGAGYRAAFVYSKSMKFVAVKIL